MLEEALAARPGRVDHAAELPVPDADARRRLIELYRGSLVLDLADPEIVVARSEGVTASFLKELLRRAALVAAERTAAGGQAAEDQAAGDQAAGTGPAAPDAAAAAAPLHVTDADMSAALDQLLDTRSQLTRVLLGGRAEHGTGATR
jgi:SpoVK/Ycf46/Vps4 family AAA+-type ATPase